MKKSSLMGASVVAAALLAAAPVVAPVASLATPGTQVVKAADDNTKNVAQKITSMATSTTLRNEDGNGNYGYLIDFSTQLNAIPQLANYRTNHHYFKTNPSATDAFQLLNRNNHDYILQTNAGMTYGNKQQVAWLLKYFFSGQNQVNLGTLDNFDAASRMSYTIQFDYSNAIGTLAFPILKASDVERVQSDMLNNGGTVTMSMQLFDGAGNEVENGLLKSTVGYNTNNNRAAYVNYTDTLSAHVGDSAETYGLTNSFLNANGKIRNYKGEDITSAVYNNGDITVSPLRERNDHNVLGNIVRGNFTKSGQYYQRVAINLRDVLGPRTNWQDALKGGLISVNGQTPSITNSDANVYLVTANDTMVDGYQYQPGDLILKRTVNVDVNQGAFKTDKINGVVTVNMNDGMAAQVYDENGKQVLGRALPNKSAWKSFEKRTYYKDGQVFYQVSTNEYVKAQDVTFTEKSSSSNSNDQLSGKVNVTKYPSKVINILNDDHAAGVYAINEDGQGMHQVIGRFLPAGSAWINQGTAEVNGNLFYQVSTNEWVSANSVAK